MPGKMARSDPRPSVRVTRGAGSGQHLASVLQEGRENANIDAGLGFIWRISGNIVRGRGMLLSFLFVALGGCALMPASGPESWDVWAGEHDPKNLPYAFVRVTPRSRRS